jgi:hypothetical protein
VCLAIFLSLLNRALISPYLVQSMWLSRRGQCIRFHGLSQRLGWLWPCEALVLGMLAVGLSTARM